MAINRNIFIYAPDIHEGDAVGNHCLGLAQVCIRLGYNVNIYAQRYSTQMQVVSILDASELVTSISSDDILFVSYSIYDSLLDDLLLLPCKKVCYYHDVTPYELLEAYEPVTAELCKKSLLQLPLLGKFNRLVATSHFSANRLSQFVHDHNFDIIPPVFEDFGLLKYYSNPNRIDNSKYFDLLYVGRIVPHKKIEDLISCFSLLPVKDDINYRLFIVGSMPNYEYNKMLFNFARQLGVSAKVTFTGTLSEADLLYRFQSSDAYLTMSLHEGFCIPVLEAMHFGIPAIIRYGTAADDLPADATLVVDSVEKAAAIIPSLREKKPSGTAYTQRAEQILAQTRDEIWGAIFSDL